MKALHVLAVAAALVVLAALPAAAAERFVIAQGGRAAATIAVGTNACGASLHTAETLREMLGRISGAAFAVTNGDGTDGLAVGTANEFPALANDSGLRLAERFAPTDLATRQGYILRSHAKGVQIIGASELAVVYGGWDLLYRLGYRQFFPEPAWEIIPQQTDLDVAVDVFEKPDYVMRHIAGSVTPDWCLRNRTSPVLGWQQASALPYLPGRWTSSLAQSQHNWGAIVNYAKEEFDVHPEYLGLVTVKSADTTQQKRVSSKLCVSNPRVRELAVRHALDYFEKEPEQPSISMEPTDGGNWCECTECAKIGPPSERVALLANTVAQALEKKFPEKYVGILAYYLHADPPARRLHPRVVVSLATAMSGSTPLAQRLTDWSKVSENLGVYEYLSVMEWHLGLPAKSLVANLPYLTTTIPHLRAKNVRFFIGQATGGAWGGQGLGYCVLSRLLWHTNEAQRVSEIVDDFLTKAFENAAEPMREYYRVIDGSQQKPGSPEFYLERSRLMYVALRAARSAAPSPAVRERIDRLALYTRYVELFALQAGAKGRDKWPALCRFVRHAYRMRAKGMVDFGLVPAYVVNAKKVELRPKPDPNKGGLLENPPVPKVDRPFADADILAMLEGKVDDQEPEDTGPVMK